jgi:hypothetical protein
MTTTTTTNQESITFLSIPNTFTDLRVVMIGTGNNQLFLRFNSDTSTNYSVSSLHTLTGGSALSGSETSNNKGISIMNPGYGLGVGQPGLFTADIFSYAGSTNKTVLTTAGLDYAGAYGVVSRNAGLWRSTAAITSVELYNGASGGNVLSAGFRVTLYGIKAA